MSSRFSLGSVLIFAFALFAVAVVVSAGPAIADVGTPDDEPRVVTTDAQPRVVEEPNSTNYLMPSADPTRQGYATTNIDVATAVSTSASRLDATHRARTFTTRYDRVGSDSSARLAVAQSTVNDSADRVAALDAEQAELFRAYSNGTLSRGQLIDRLVRLDARASQSAETLRAVRSRVRSDPTTSLPSDLNARIATLQSELVVLPAPLTDRLAASAVGRADPTDTYVGGVDGSLVLATVDDGRFYRQATVRSAHRGDGSTNFSEAFEQVRALYPWVYSGGPQFEPGLSKGTGIYRLDASHPQGTLTAYLSGSSTDIFHESQSLDLDTVPVYNTISEQNASLNVTVSTTIETGPMQVVLRDRDSGDPLNGTVLVDGEPVTTTGDDGTVWTVRPAGPFEMTVLSDGERVELGRGYFFR
jgi:hypothetical protein